jgi:hypothetical protein
LACLGLTTGLWPMVGTEEGGQAPLPWLLTQAQAGTHWGLQGQEDLALSPVSSGSQEL